MRLELTRKTDLALRVMQALADGAPRLEGGDLAAGAPRLKGGDLAAGAPRLKGGDLAAAVGTTPTYIGQVVAPLVRAGWVGSDPGPTGGYRLTPGLGGLTLLELVEAVEGPTDDGRCVLRDGPCHPVAQPCALHDAWVRARDALLHQLSATPVVLLPDSEGVAP